MVINHLLNGMILQVISLMRAASLFFQRKSLQLGLFSCRLVRQELLRLPGYIQTNTSGELFPDPLDGNEQNEASNDVQGKLIRVVTDQLTFHRLGHDLRFGIQSL